MAIVLASTSPYRRELMHRLRLPFEVVAPDVDEARLPAEAPLALARRLAEAKATEVARRRPDAVVIGSDQVAELDGEPIGKPHTHAAALAQLELMQGRRLVFHTALAVAAHEHVEVDSIPTTVTFRRLARDALEAYLRADQPDRKYTWFVRVVQVTTDGQGGERVIPLSPPSGMRAFYWG